MKLRLPFSFTIAALLLVCAAPLVNAQQWRAGLAKVVITPDRPVWLAGYAARTKPSEGKIHDLYAKALVLEDAKGNRLVIVTTDLLGFPRPVAEAIADEAKRRFKLSRQRLALTSSHTHTGPVVGHSLNGAYDLNAEQVAAVQAYTAELQRKVVAVIGEALRNLKPARLSFGHSEAGFVMNRRQRQQSNVSIGVNEKGLVDRDVPVLRIESLTGELRGVLFGYACHNTTLTGEFYQFSGDYAGFAQAGLEKSHPGAQAMFVMGCGADANPNPRSRLEYAIAHGAELAQAVEQALTGKMQPLRGSLSTAFARLPLQLTSPSRAEFQARLHEKDVYRKRHAERWLARLDRDGKLDLTYPYPVQVAQLGDGLTFIALGGEVVVDYVLRLKKEFGADKLWVAGYSNDVMAYIPSVRILDEGGYEAEGAMIYYDLPGRWAADVEEKIIGKVHELVRECRRGSGK